MFKNLLLIIASGVFCFASLAQSHTFQLVEKATATTFPLVSANKVTAIYVDTMDHPLVRKAASLLASDIALVTGKKPAIVYDIPATADQLVIVGSMDSSRVVQELSTSGKLNTGKIKGKWEAYQADFIKDAFKGIRRVLVIAGSDRRGTAYGEIGRAHV